MRFSNDATVIYEGNPNRADDHRSILKKPRSIIGCFGHVAHGTPLADQLQKAKLGQALQITTSGVIGHAELRHAPAARHHPLGHHPGIDALLPLVELCLDRWGHRAGDRCRRFNPVEVTRRSVQRDNEKTILLLDLWFTQAKVAF